MDKIMKADMTYNEVDLCREEVKKMMEYIKALHSKALVIILLLPARL